MRAPIPSFAVDAGCSVRFDFSGCISFRMVLRDVPSVVQSWGATENIRLQSMTPAISFLCVFFCCSYGKFVANEKDSVHRLRPDCV